MNPFRFENPTALYYGKRQIEQFLIQEISRFGKKVLLVYGGGSIKKIGLYDQIMKLMQDADIEVWEQSGIEPNPRISTIRQGVEICKREAIDLVLAVGGGSVLDASKAIAAGAKYAGDAWDFYSKKQRMKIQDSLPLGTILTLSATGSEMNGNSVVSNLETEQKLSTASIHSYPKFSFCDPSLTFSVPKDQTIYGIVDMMSHIFEQYFSHTKSIPLQERICESILGTILEYAESAIQDPDNYDAREALMYCSTMALNGIPSMGVVTDWACHSIEHEVSAIYDIPHGGGLAIIFPNWMKYVVDANPSKFAKLATRVFGVDDAGKNERAVALEGIEAIRNFLNRIGAPNRLADYDIGSDRIREMACKAAESWGGQTIGNFMKLTVDDVENILKASL